MQTIIVDMTPGFRMPTIYYSQGDVGTQFAIDLRSRFGDSFPAGTTVTIQATKPSGFGFSVAATSVTNGVAAFTTTAEMTDEFGRFPAELKVTKTGLTLFTANFYMDGEENTHPEGTIDGQQETVIPELAQLVERVEDAASSVLDRQTVTNTLPAGSQASYSFDEDTNTQTFGIPQGEAGAGAAGVVASAYSASSTYAVGDYVIHNSNLYRCTTAITTAESFTAAHWTQVVLGDDVSDLKSDKLTKLFDYNMNDNYDFDSIVVGVPSGNAWGFSVEPTSYSVANGVLTYSPSARSDILRKGFDLVNGHNYYVYLPISSPSEDAFFTFAGSHASYKNNNSFIEKVFTWSSASGFWFFMLQGASGYDYEVGGLLAIDMTANNLTEAEARLIGAYLRAESNTDISNPLQLYGLTKADTKVLNVKDFGAIGDGLYDNTAVFANAISACGSGDTLYVPSGTYRIENIQLKSHMKICGDGVNSVIYMKKRMTNQNYNCLTVNECEDVTIENLCLYGNKDENYTTQNNADSGWNGIHVRESSKVRVNNVTSKSNGYHGIIMVDVDDVIVSNSEFYDNGFRPIHGHGTIKNVEVYNCYCHENGQGFSGETGGGSSLGNGFDAIFFFDGVDNLYIHDNRIEEPNTLACIQVGGSLGAASESASPHSTNIRIIGNVCKTSKSIKGIHIMGDVDGIEVASNMILGGYDGIFVENQASNKEVKNLNIHDNTCVPLSFGIRLRNECSRVNIHDNIIKGGNQFGIYVVDTNSVLVNGNLINDSQFGIVFESSSIGVADKNICIKDTEMLKGIWAKDSCSKINFLNSIVPSASFITNASADGVTQNTIVSA